MSAPWSPLSAREGTAPFELREDVPASLEPALREWIFGAVQKLGGSERRLMIRLDLVLPRSYVEEYNRAHAEYQRKLRERSEALAQRASTQERAPASTPTTLTLNYATLGSFAIAPAPPHLPSARFIAYGTPRTQLLDVVDGLLNLLPYQPPPQPTTDPIRGLVNRARTAMRTKEREQLQQLLSDSHMIYRVRANGRGLERWVSVLSTAAALTAADAAEGAGYPVAARRLTQAWNKAYALKPDPGGAYHDAVRAVETVANPLFLPNDPKPTLGKVLAHLDDAADTYEFVIAGELNQPASIDAVRQMIRTLWFGHRDRHEGGPTSAPITLGSAQAAVAVAVCLVHLLATGCIGRKE